MRSDVRLLQSDVGRRHVGEPRREVLADVVSRPELGVEQRGRVARVKLADRPVWRPAGRRADQRVPATLELLTKRLYGCLVASVEHSSRQLGVRYLTTNIVGSRVEGTGWRTINPCNQSGTG